MFTEGLDQNAINWIQKGSHADQEPVRIRSPLAENLSHDLFPKSPLPYSSNTSFMSPHGLPPLKFHSSLLAPSSLVAPRLSHAEDDEEESVASVSNDGTGAGFSDYEEDEIDEILGTKPVARCYDEEELFGYKPGSKLNRWLLKEKSLKVEIPNGNRRLTDGDSGLRKFGLKNSTSGSPCMAERFRLRPTQGSPFYPKGMPRDVEDMGTPSAPPMIEIGTEDKSMELEKQVQNEDVICEGVELEISNGSKGGLEGDCRSHCHRDAELHKSMNNIKTGKDVQIPYWQTSSENLACYNTRGQYAWQSLVAYDACIRLCLYAWSRGSAEAPEFLRDECLLLRSAFGLHKFLLQPRGVRPTELNPTTKAEQRCTLKTRKVVGKLRVEVRKVRLIPRIKLKSTSSLRTVIYMQMGADYIRQVSSFMKTGMNSLKQATLSAASEEQLSCLFQLKSATEDAPNEQGSAVCLHPGTGDHHVFFPESEGDAILIEVQDKKKEVQGRGTIPVSSLTDSPNENVRWWPIYHDDQECVGKIQLIIGISITSDEDNVKSGPIVETLAYDLLLEAAMRAQHFHSRNLRLQGPWKWLLNEFADYYGVSDSYTKLRYLSHIMNMATPIKACLLLVNELLMPILKARSERTLTRQEKSILLDCETRIENLLATVFENYKSLDENSPSGLADIFGPIQETASPALSPAVQTFTLLHDILSQDAQNMLRNYLETAARKRCRKHMVETDEFVSSSSEGFLLDSITISTAYLKMKNLCITISKDIEADIKINNEHVLPSSIDLSSIAAAVYSTQLCNRLKAFLSAVPPSCPQSHVNELVVAVSDFEQDLDSWSISPVQGGVDARGLFHNYIMVWIHDMELRLLDRCKAEKVPWSCAMTNHSTSPFAEDMYERIKDSLLEYEVVISRWPQYSLILENAVADVEKAIVKSLEKQYNDILTPLKDSIPNRLNLHVQKLTRRQSMTVYSIPNQLGTFLNSIKRILDFLHCKVEDILKAWASCLPVIEDKKLLVGEQMNAITVMLRTKYKNYMQAAVEKLVSNMQTNRSTRLKRILEEIKEEDGEADVRERMQMLCSLLADSISNLHDVFSSQIFVASCRVFWDRMGRVVLKFLEGRKENQVRYKGSCYALVILDDTFASQMQRLQGNSLQEKDLEPPRSVIEARSILCRDTANANEPSTYFYV